MQYLNLLLKKVERIDKRVTETEKVLQTLTTSGGMGNRVEESCLATNVLEPVRLSASHSVQQLQNGDSFVFQN